MQKKLFVSFMTLIFGLVVFAPSAFAQTPVGTWKTIDDETGQAKSHVTIYKGKNGKLYGKVTKLLKNPGAKCTACKGKKKDQPIEGMTIMWGLEKDDDEWEDGKILDPKKGKTYTCKIWLDGKNKLKVRGYIGFLYRTQTWHRVK